MCRQRGALKFQSPDDVHKVTAINDEKNATQTAPVAPMLKSEELRSVCI